MFFLQKKLWIAWSKLRFLRLPVEKRVRLEVTTDGRHLTFLLVSLYEAGYGVQVVGIPAVFRELICLRKSAPIPFVVGGKERVCGISITDQPSTLASRPSTLFVLDYDYFSGLTTPRRQGSRSGDCREQPERARREGSSESTCPKERDTGKIIDSKIIETTEDMEVAVGLRLASQAGDAFSNPSTSELARDSENTPLTRSANGPAEEALRAEMQRSGNIEPHPGGWAAARETAARQPEGRIETLGKVEKDCREAAPKEEQVGKTCESNERERTSQITRIYTDGQQGDAQETCAGDAFSNPSTSELARDSENTSPTRSANNPASSPATSHSPPATALRAPYFMHPSVYHRGLHKRRSQSTALDPRLSTLDSTAKQRRRFRIGFFGTHDREFYTQHYHFPRMNRFEILEVFLGKFRDRMRRLRGFPRDWDPCEIAVSIDDRGGDRSGKFFLSQDHYLEALRECDFVLSPPGWCMPVSHNLVEAMFCGAIPITNGGDFMAEPLADGKNCLEFEDVEDLVTVIERALAMDAGEVLKMRQAVSDYYDRFLNPKAFAEELSRSDCRRVFLNAEENSVPFVFPRKF